MMPDLNECAAVQPLSPFRVMNLKSVFPALTARSDKFASNSGNSACE
jgi:hypothetical protein